MLTISIYSYFCNIEKKSKLISKLRDENLLLGYVSANATNFAVCQRYTTETQLSSRIAMSSDATTVY